MIAAAVVCSWLILKMVRLLDLRLIAVRSLKYVPAREDVPIGKGFIHRSGWNTLYVAPENVGKASLNAFLGMRH